MKKVLSCILLFCIICSISAGCEFAAADKDVDFDLSIMTSTLAFAQMQNIMQGPDNFIGKTMKIKGEYSSAYFGKTQQFYHFISVVDQITCCQETMEFILAGKKKTIQDYPYEGDQIELTGTFKKYIEEEKPFYHLVVNDVIVLDGTAIPEASPSTPAHTPAISR